MDERINILRKYNLRGDTAFDFGFRRSEYNEKIMDFTGNRLVKILKFLAKIQKFRIYPKLFLLLFAISNISEIICFKDKLVLFLL